MSSLRHLLFITTVSTLALIAGCSSDSEGASPATSERRASAGKDTASGEFTVLTYNVAGLPAEISKENPKEHLPLISPLLDEYDIVLTQEDFDWWGPVAAAYDFVHYHERLRADATHPHKTARHPGPEAVGLDLTERDAPLIGDGQGIMSRFEFDDEVRVPWSGCFGGFDTSDGGAADCLAMKGFAVVTMTLAPGIEVDVYTLHIEAGGTPKDQELQAQDVDELVAFINDHSAGRAVILGGDTNLHTDSDHPDASGDADTELWARLLADTGLNDACAITKCTDTARIDKIAARSSDAVDLEVTELESPADRFVDANGDDLSDHQPVVASFSWSAAGKE